MEPDPSMKHLPHHHNRGIPKTTYELEFSSKVRYLMSNYVSKHRLFESNKSFVNQLSTVVIPNIIQEALADPRWIAAMNEKMKSLQKKMNYGNLLIVYLERSQLSVVGSILLSTGKW